MTSTFQPNVVIPAPWIGVDFNRTLAVYHSFEDDMRQAEPIPSVVNMVKRLLADGKVVKILTAQVWVPQEFFRYLNGELKASHPGPEWMAQASLYFERAGRAESIIKDWCWEHIGQELEVTCERDPGCIEIWDDKARPVIPNQGLPHENTSSAS